MTTSKRTPRKLVAKSQSGDVEIPLPAEFAVYQRRAIRAQRLVIALIVVLALMLSTIEAKRQTETNHRFTQLLEAFSNANFVHRTRNEAHPFCESAVDGEAAHRIYLGKDWSAREATQYYTQCDDIASREVIPPKRVSDPLRFRSVPLPASTPAPTATPAPARTGSRIAPSHGSVAPSSSDGTPSTTRPPARSSPKPTGHAPSPTPTCTVACVPSP